MKIVDAEIARVRTIAPGTAPDYDHDNPIRKLLQAIEETSLAADREHYLADSLQHLLPLASIELYGPSSSHGWEERDPRRQDDRGDFQKQNLHDFTLADTRVLRGYAIAGEVPVSFLNLSYAPGPGSPLLGGNGVYPGQSLRLCLAVGEASTGDGFLDVPYNPATSRYEIELWAWPEDRLPPLGEKGETAVKAGRLLPHRHLVKGRLADFDGPAFQALRAAARRENRSIDLFSHMPDHTLHPVRPLRIELAWSDAQGRSWAPAGGASHRYEFCLSQRGWGSYLGLGESANPHGGIGTLEFRNLYSNYFEHERRRRQALGQACVPELGRELAPWNFDANGKRPPEFQREAFMAVDYMDLHILRRNAAIGIHRHRDNQEVFLLLDGKALIVTGDWAEYPGRERAFEIRTMRPGDLVLVKGGQMHALVNSQDRPATLFMFGGYD